jgi:hypothetical protein
MGCVYTVTLQGGGPWGIRIRGGKDFSMPLSISHVTAGGKGSQAGIIIGEQILEINGNSTKDLVHVAAQKLIKSTGQTLTLTLNKSTGSSPVTSTTSSTTQQPAKVSNSKPQFKPLVQPARGGVQPSQYLGNKYQVNTTYAPTEIVNASSNPSDTSFPKTPPSPTATNQNSFPSPPTSSFPPPPTEFLKSSPSKPTMTSPEMTSSTISSYTPPQSYTPSQGYTLTQKFTKAPKIDDRPSALATKSEIDAFQQRVQCSQRPTVTSSQPKPVSQPLSRIPPEQIVASLPVTAQSKTISNSTPEFTPPPPPPPVADLPKMTSSSQPLSQAPKTKSQPNNISKPVQASSNFYQNSNFVHNLADEVNNIQLAESRNKASNMRNEKSPKENSKSNKSPICHACGKPIRGKYCQAIGKDWHPECFVCQTPGCGVPLQQTGFIENKGTVFCRTCFERDFAYTCAKCDEKIIGDVMHALNQTWHMQCFVCAACGKPFLDGIFHWQNEKPYCVDDYNKIFATFCRGCDLRVEAGDQYIEALGHSWHDNCFTCATCHVDLRNSGFYNRNSLPVCKAHAR